MSLTKMKIIRHVSNLGFSKQDAGNIIEDLLEIIKIALKMVKTSWFQDSGNFR